MKLFFVLGLAIFCNLMLLSFLSRTSAYNFLKSNLPQRLIDAMYEDDDSERSPIITKIMNFLSFVICVIGGYIFFPQYYMEFLPFIIFIFAKVRAKSLAITEIRLFILKTLIEQNKPQTLDIEFATCFTEIMQHIDKNYIFYPNDYPTKFEIVMAWNMNNKSSKRG